MSLCGYLMSQSSKEKTDASLVKSVLSALDIFLYIYFSCLLDLQGYLSIPPFIFFLI